MSATKKVELYVGFKSDLNGDGKYDVRLTPVHTPVVLPAIVADILVGLLSSMDWSDEIPGNGEVDIDVNADWLAKLPSMPLGLITKIPNSKVFVKIKYSY